MPINCDVCDKEGDTLYHGYGFCNAHFKELKDLKDTFICVQLLTHYIKKKRFYEEFKSNI